jgi:hypothetical protein
MITSWAMSDFTQQGYETCGQSSLMPRNLGNLLEFQCLEPSTHHHPTFRPALHIKTATPRIHVHVPDTIVGLLESAVMKSIATRVLIQRISSSSPGWVSGRTPSPSGVTPKWIKATTTHSSCATIIRNKSSSSWVPPTDDDEDDDDEDDRDHHHRDGSASDGIIISAPATATHGPSSSEAAQSAAVQAVTPDKEHQRIWLPHSAVEPLYWSDGVGTGLSSSSPLRPNNHNNNNNPPNDLEALLERIERQEFEGGRMRDSQYGVLHEDPAVDMRLLTENYTVHSLASALRDREEMLQFASQLAAEGDFKTLQVYLRDCHPDVILERRHRSRRLDLRKPLNATSLETIRKGLMR